jgi:tRNA pseudouridine55 synthase
VFVVLDRRGRTQLTSFAEEGRFDQAIIPASRLLPHFPNATVDALTVAQIRQGKDFRLSPFVNRTGAKHVKAVSQEGDLIAIGEARLPHLYYPILVL